MPRLAGRAIATYRDTDRERYLDNLHRLEIVAGRYQDAGATLRTLRDLRVAAHRANASASSLPYEIYARAKAAQREEGLSFDDAFRKSYREIVGKLDDWTAAHRLRWVFGTSAVRLKNNFRDAVRRVNGEGALPLPDSIDLVRKYAAAQSFDCFQSLTAALEDEDDRRRYLIDRNVPVRTPDGATVCVLVVRPRVMPGRLPALLNFTIYADTAQNMAEARPKALKALTPSVTFAPGIDFPMDGNVFMSYAYPWPFYTTHSKALDNATYNDRMTRASSISRYGDEQGSGICCRFRIRCNGIARFVYALCAGEPYEEERIEIDSGFLEQA